MSWNHDVVGLKFGGLYPNNPVVASHESRVRQPIDLLVYLPWVLLMWYVTYLEGGYLGQYTPNAKYHGDTLNDASQLGKLPRLLG